MDRFEAVPQLAGGVHHPCLSHLSPTLDAEHDDVHRRRRTEGVGWQPRDDRGVERTDPTSSARSFG
jgi:hypothetical protein